MSQKTKNELTEETKEARRNNAAKARQTKKEKADALKDVRDKPISVEDVFRYDENDQPSPVHESKKKKKHHKKYESSSSSESSESESVSQSESSESESESPKKKKKATKKKEKKSPKAKKLPKVKFNSQDAYNEINTKLNALVQVYLDKAASKAEKNEKKEDKNKPQTVSDAIENPPKTTQKQIPLAGDDDHFAKMMQLYSSQFTKR